MSKGNSGSYKTGSAQKAKKQLEEAREQQRKRLEEIQKEMQSSTVGSK